MAAPEGRAASCQDDNPAFTRSKHSESEVIIKCQLQLQILINRLPVKCRS